MPDRRNKLYTSPEQKDAWKARKSRPKMQTPQGKGLRRLIDQTRRAPRKV